jgi:hypothetical protein
MDVDILPGAALNDPELQQTVRQKIEDAVKRESSKVQHWVGERSRERAERMLNVLANYGWQEFAYKYGFWARATTDSWGFTGAQKLYDRILMIDPGSGAPIAELAFGGGGPSFLREAGRVWFAGDPQVGGVITPVGDGKRDVKLAVRPPAGGASWDAVLTMRSGQPLPFVPDIYVDKFGDQRPWVVDHPEKPSRKSLVRMDALPLLAKL